jgi:hypothetical protein
MSMPTPAITASANNDPKMCPSAPANSLQSRFRVPTRITNPFISYPTVVAADIVSNFIRHRGDVPTAILNAAVVVLSQSGGDAVCAKRDRTN